MDNNENTENRNWGEESMALHRALVGKIGMVSKVRVNSTDDLSVSYTPGVAEPCRVLSRDSSLASQLTLKGNSIAIVSDGTAVLGLGNIGPYGAIPVMEGKALLMKEFADLDAWPICLDTSSVDEIVQVVRAIAPVFGGINLEDIAAPQCFEVERRLQDLGIPVFHDDQHGTAVVLAAALLNSMKIVNANLQDLRIVINGAGAAGSAIAELLLSKEYLKAASASRAPDLTVIDSKGAIHLDRDDLNEPKRELAKMTNPQNRKGSLAQVVKGAHVFIGVSKPDTLSEEMVASMAKDPMVFAMANPKPEIMPDKAKAAGARIVATGRSDFPNQVNNLLVFPGIFRGALDSGAKQITTEVQVASAVGIAKAVGPSLSENMILPSPLNRDVATVVAKAVAETVKQNS